MIKVPTHRHKINVIEGITMPNVLNPSDITTTVDWIHTVEGQNPTFRKYLPFDGVTIINNGEDAIVFYPNESDKFRKLIPKGTIWTFNAPSDVPALRSWRIKINSTTTVTAGKVSVQLRKEGMESDSLSKKVASSWLGKLIGL